MEDLEENKEVVGSTLYNFLFALFGILIIGLVGFNAYLLIENQSGASSDASVADSTITAEAQDKAPPILDLISNTKNLSNIYNSLFESPELEALLVAGEYTVFAPSDSAFTLLLDIPQEANEIYEIYSYHIVEGTVSTETLDNNMNGTLTTVQGESLTIGRDGESYTLTDTSGETAYITSENIPAYNGAIHIINRVLFPFGEGDPVVEE